MNSPFFSIILPTFNRVNFIPKAIHSILFQTFTDWELIVVDDGSTDGTKILVESYNDNRIKYLYQENSERSAARNNGIENSSGLYICFLDSDDYYLENHLKNLYEIIIIQNFPVSMFYVLRGFETEGIITYPQEIIEKSINNVELVLKTMIATSQVCLHFEILKIHRFNTLFRIGEDLELWSRIVVEFPLIKINKYTLISKVHDGNSVNFKSGNYYKETLLVLKHIFANNKISSQISINQKLISLSNCYLGIARYFLSQNKKSFAIFYLSKSIIYYPFHKQTKYKVNLIKELIINN